MKKMRVARRAVIGGLAGTLLMPLAPQRAATQWVDKKRLAEADATAAGIDQLHSLIVSIRGERQIARAYRGSTLHTPVNVKSVSKTLMATLVMIAVDKGILASTAEPMLPLLGKYAPSNTDPLAANVTVDHLLTMRSGLVRTSGQNYGDWVSSRDWVEYILSKPLEARPGTRMMYSTGDYHLLSALLTNVTGETTHTLANEWLGVPLGLPFPQWNRDPKGIFMGGNNMHMSPNGMIRFGEMALGGGVYEDTRVVSERSLNASWTPRARSPFSGHQYGYGWFQTLMAGVRVYYARGYGGQMIYVIPQRETVVAITSDVNRPARSSGHGGVLNRLLAEKILPSIGRV